MGQFAKGSVCVSYGSRRAEDGRWAAVVIKTAKGKVSDISPSETFLWRSTAWRKAKALARSRINLFIPESTPASREKTAMEVAKWAFGHQEEFLRAWRNEFAPYLRVAA